jgi:hypothetical protein
VAEAEGANVLISTPPPAVAAEALDIQYMDASAIIEVCGMPYDP